MAETNTRWNKSEMLEAWGSALWLLMDLFWHKGLVTPTLFLILPTISLHFLALVFAERKFVHITLTGAINAWVVANVLWIIADPDIGSLPVFDVPSDIFFWLAIALTGIGLAKMAQEEDFSPFFKKFRRLRIPVK